MRAGLRHTAATYREAALEHAQLAWRLHHRSRDYAPAHYWAGLAVECMLRAYRLGRDPVFDSRHDLAKLADESRFFEHVPARQQRQAAAALTAVVVRWRNDLRFTPARLVSRWLHESRLDERARGDRLKRSSGAIVTAALVVVGIGDDQWPFSTD